MDILLIFPPISVEERYGVMAGKEVASKQAPLGIAYIAAFLEKKGFSAGIVDAPTLDLNMDDVLDAVKDKHPDAVGISSLTPSFHKAVLLAEKIKQQFPDVPVIIGGQHATIMKQKILEEHKCFDIVVYGEGELTAYELVKLNKEKKLDARHMKNINGIAFYGEKGIVVTPPRAPIQDLDSLPFPARHLLPMDKYLPMPSHYKRTPVANMIVIRGCPFQCIFCSAHAVFGRKIRYPSPERVVEEIKLLVRDYGVREIAFWDDMLTANRQWLEKICDMMTNEKIGIVWSCSARADSVDRELLKKMHEAGCWSIFYGIESGSQELLDKIKKGITLEQIRNAVKWTKEAGIEVRGSFMLCLPGETPELARKTIALAKELDVDYAQFSLTTPYPGTKLYDIARSCGHLDEDFNKYSSWSPVFLPFGYSSTEEAKQMHSEAFRQFYLRPKYIIKRVMALRSFGDIRKQLKGMKLMSSFVRKKSGYSI